MKHVKYTGLKHSFQLKIQAGRSRAASKGDALARLAASGL
jgi:hypothetical protein